ncbi:MAG: hypothetical protein HY775_04095 [Acidobacteria bacterium]|nr:hypothetical protein [Acidobacteriota bacterium]
MVKKIAALLVLLLALGMVPLLAQAHPEDEQCTGSTPAGWACVDPDEGEVEVDGAATNPDPLDGYVVVYGIDGKICYSSSGGPDDYPPSPDEECQAL